MPSLAFTNCFHIFWQVPYQLFHSRSSTSRACGPEMKRCHDYFGGFWRECSHKMLLYPMNILFHPFFLGNVGRSRQLPLFYSWNMGPYRTETQTPQTIVNMAFQNVVKWPCQILGVRLLSRHDGPLMNWIREDSWYPNTWLGFASTTFCSWKDPPRNACCPSASGGYRWHWTS